jgi:hypothetical protein
VPWHRFGQSGGKPPHSKERLIRSLFATIFILDNPALNLYYYATLS